MGDSNRILTVGNATRAASTIAGAPATQATFQGLPLGTVGDVATAELGLKVIMIGSGALGGFNNTLNTLTTGTVTATSTSGMVLDAGNRKYALLINTGANDAWLAFGGNDAVVGSGIYLKSGGGSYEITSANFYAGVINAITTSSTTNIATTEGT